MPKKTTQDQPHSHSHDSDSNEQSLIGPNTTWDMTIAWSEIEPIYNKTIAKLAKKVKSPGFRPGKVPPAIAAGMIGHEELAERTLQEIMPAKYSEELDKNKKKPITRPSITIKQSLLNQDWVVEVAIAERPLVEVKDYKKVVTEAKKAAKKGWADHLKEHHAEDKKAKGDQKDQKPEPSAEQLADEEKNFTLQEVYKALVMKFKPVIPELLLKEHTQQELDYIVRQLESMKMTLADYLKHRQMTFEQLSTDLAMQVLGRLELEFVLEAIKEESKLEASDNDLEKYLERIADPKARAAQKDNPEYRHYITQVILRDKLTEYLLSL